MNKLIKTAGRRAAAGALLVAVSASQFAMAAGIDISADTTAAKTDIQTAGGLIIGVVVAIAAIGWLRRVMR